MKKILRVTVPLTQRVAPVIGALLILVGLIASSQIHSQTTSPTVTTDKSDYSPGDTVVISGTGWIPGQPVSLKIEETDSDLPWTTSVTPVRTGTFSNSSFVIQAHDLGVLFTLTATQGTLSAWTQFTDSVGPGLALNGDPGGFEIDGDLLATARSGHTDWLANGGGTTGLLDISGAPVNTTNTFRRIDAADNTSNTKDDIFAGSNKTADNPSTYTWKTASAGNKDDLNNVYVHVSKDSSGNSWVTASADRFSNSGTAFVDFELNQAQVLQVTDVGCSSPPCGHFATNPAGAVAGDPLFASGGRTVNDLLITSQYNSGGSQATIIVYQWKGCSIATPCTIPSATTGFGWLDITASIAAGGGFVATNTVNGVSVPYGAFGLTTYQENQFVEMSLNVSSLIKAAFDPCVGVEVQTIFVKTKVATSDSAGLDDFVTPINLSLNAGFVITLNQTPVKCFGESNGTVTVSADGGTAPYVVTLDGANPQIIATNGGSVIYTGLSAGSHTAHVVATGGCAKDKSITVTQPASAVGSSITSQTNVSCFGASTGSVTVAGSGGTSPYTYSIDGMTFQSSGTFSNLAAGSYTVTVKDANGCTTTQPVTITGPSAGISASETTTPASCHGGSDGSVTVTVSGGTSPYSVTVNGVTHTGVTSSTTFTGLASGTYSASITDAHGCTGSASGVLVDQPAAIVASETTSPASCNGSTDGSVTVTVSGGTAPYSVTVNGVTHTGVTSSTTFTGLAAGTYPASITDAHGCTSSASGVVTSPPSVTTGSSKTNPLCSGQLGSMSVTFSGGTPGYQCSLDNGAFVACSSPATFNNLAGGSHTVNVKDSHGCTGPAQTQTIVVPSPVNAVASTTQASSSAASDGTATITVTGGTPGYTITLNGVTQTVSSSGGSTTFGGLGAGSYNVIITDANGCGVGIIALIGFAPPPSIEVNLCNILSSLGTGVSTQFQVTLPGGPLSTPLTVFYVMSGTAIQGVDYKLSAGQFTIPAGQTTASITITAVGNRARTTNRTATMTIVDTVTYFGTPGANTATVTIRR